MGWTATSVSSPEGIGHPSRQLTQGCHHKNNNTRSLQSDTRRMMHGFSVAIHDMSVLVELRRSINACVSPFNCTRFLFVCSSTYTVSVVFVLKMSLWQRFRSIWPRRFFCAERWESNSKMKLCKHYLFKFTCESRSCCAHLGIVRRHVTEVPSDPNAPADCGVRRKSNIQWQSARRET